MTAFVSLLFAARGWTVVAGLHCVCRVSSYWRACVFGHLAGPDWRCEDRADLRADRGCGAGTDLDRAVGIGRVDRSRSHRLRLVAGLSGCSGSRPSGAHLRSNEVWRWEPTRQFLDLALGLASPVLGLIAGAAGITAVFPCERTPGALCGNDRAYLAHKPASELNNG